MSTKTEIKQEEPAKRKLIQPVQQEKSFKRPKVKGKKDTIAPISAPSIQQTPIPSVGVSTIAIPPQTVFSGVVTDALIRNVARYYKDVFSHELCTPVTSNVPSFALLPNLTQFQGVQMPASIPANVIQSMLGVPGIFSGNLNQQGSNSNQMNVPSTQNQVPLEQQITRQALLEQLRQQLPQNQIASTNAPQVELNSKPQDPRVQKANVVAPAKVLKSPTSPVPVQKSAHHEILRQHNEEYKMTQVKKSAVQLANTQYGNYAPYDSLHYNFVIPCLPVHLIEGYKSAPIEEST